MKICAVSDLHGRLPQIPPCDVLVIAGDICPDTHARSLYDPDLMRVAQMEWLAADFAEWEQTVPAKHIFVTPGNHDWINQLPEHCISRFFIDNGCEVGGKQFWFTPWVSPCGDWNYTLNRDQRRGRFADMPVGIDLLVAHSPAYGLGDRPYGEQPPAGCPELRMVIYQREPRFMVFGHIHEGRRYGVSYLLGKTTLFNVAMWGSDWTPTVFEI